MGPVYLQMQCSLAAWWEPCPQAKREVDKRVEAESVARAADVERCLREVARLVCHTPPVPGSTIHSH